ncbi:IPT/TIG domain-containing protein, partial [Nocardia sp. NPDC046763]
MPTITSLSPTSGPTTGGTSVTITGTGFTGPTTVLFGTTATTFTLDSATQITAIAPAGS